MICPGTVQSQSVLRSNRKLTGWKWILQIDAPIMFNIYHHLASLPALRQNQLHSQELGALYYGQQKPQNIHQESVTSNSTLQPAFYSQRSVILYNSIKVSHIGDDISLINQPNKLHEAQMQHSSSQVFKSVTENFKTIEYDLKIKMQDYPKHKLSEAGSGEKYTLCHLFQQQLYKREINSSTQGKAVGQSHQHLPLLVTQSYFSAQDEKTPLLFYQGQLRNNSSSHVQSSSSSNVDSHRSNKDATTDEDKSSAFSSYCKKCSRMHQPTSTLPPTCRPLSSLFKPRVR